MKLPRALLPLVLLAPIASAELWQATAHGAVGEITKIGLHKKITFRKWAEISTDDGWRPRPSPCRCMLWKKIQHRIQRYSSLSATAILPPPFIVTGTFGPMLGGVPWMGQLGGGPPPQFSAEGEGSIPQSSF